MNPCTRSLHVWVSHLLRVDKVFPVSMCGQGFPVSQSTIWQNCSQGNFKVGTVARESTRVGESSEGGPGFSAIKEWFPKPATTRWEFSKNDCEGGRRRQSVLQTASTPTLGCTSLYPHTLFSESHHVHLHVSFQPFPVDLVSSDRTSLKVTFCFFYFPWT